MLRDRGADDAVLGVLGENHAGDLRIVARREEDEPAVIAQVHLVPRRRRLSPCYRDDLAVPVLPETSRPGILPRPPVPPPLTTSHRPSCSAEAVEP